MKKLNRYLSIFALVVVSGTPLLNKPVIATEAALTAPASYDIRYYDDSIAFKLSTSTESSYLSYSRTTDSSYHSYTTTILGTELSSLPDGLDITMIFNRSNTGWSAVGGGLFEPADTKIGSDNTVGTITNKYFFNFNNQTNKNYLLYLDISSTTSDGNWIMSYNDNNQVIWSSSVYVGSATTLLRQLYLPAYTSLKLGTGSSSAARYFDAWYLKDLGVSGAYDAGFDAGEIVGYEDGYNNSASPLWDGVELTVGVILNFVLFIMTLSVFDISLLSIGVVLLSVLSLVWILKALRG
jgi:hypothetical protein